MTSEPDQPEEAEVVATDPEPTTAALVPIARPETALVEPAASTEMIVLAVQKHQEVCNAILDDNDYQHIQGRKYRKKSGWRKLSVAYGVSCELVHRDYERRGDRIIRAEVTVRATAPNGRFMDGLGACDLYEKCCREGYTKGGKHRHCPAARGEKCNYEHFSHPQHDLPATAHTRATNRACADLFGLGEVSAEEMVDRDDSDRAESEKLATTEQYQALANEVKSLPDAERDRVVTGEGELMGVKVREGHSVTATEAQVLALTATVKGLREATPDASDPEQAPFDNPADTSAAHPGVIDVPGPDDLVPKDSPHGYDLWSSADLEAECVEHGLPKSGTNANKIARIRAFDTQNRPLDYVEPDVRPF